MEKRFEDKSNKMSKKETNKKKKETNVILWETELG